MAEFIKFMTMFYYKMSTLRITYKLHINTQMLLSYLVTNTQGRYHCIGGMKAIIQPCGQAPYIFYAFYSSVSILAISVQAGW